MGAHRAGFAVLLVEVDRGAVAAGVLAFGPGVAELSLGAGRPPGVPVDVEGVPVVAESFFGLPGVVKGLYADPAAASVIDTHDSHHTPKMSLTVTLMIITQQY
jgi:hypothetical protein